MSRTVTYLRELIAGTTRGWNRFWFTPADPATLCLIRICSGAMLFYTHCVWALDLEAFFGPRSWIDRAAFTATHGDGYAWSYLWYCESPPALWTVHILSLVVFALLTIGLFSRTVAVLAYLITVSYANRVPTALFGLDQINAFLAMYVMLGPCGAVYSLDHWLSRRRAAGTPPINSPPYPRGGRGGRLDQRATVVEYGAAKPQAMGETGGRFNQRAAGDGRDDRVDAVELPPAPRRSAPTSSITANIAVRLIQLHLCILYFFAGISKLQGPAWWDGSAIWLAVANREYQSIDMTWLAGWPLLVNLCTHVALFWEISYCALIWPRLTRPLVLLFAVPLHLGIACCLGMTTFGLVMLIANLAFVPPELVREAIDRFKRRSHRRTNLPRLENQAIRDTMKVMSRQGQTEKCR